MELTEEKIAEIAAQAAAKVVEELKLPNRRFPPGGDENPPEDKPSFKTLGGFLIAVNEAYHKTLKPDDWRAKVLSEGTDSAGGFLVPEQFMAGIEQTMLETAIVRPLARKMPMTTDSLKYPKVVDTSHSSSVHGGVICYWAEEHLDKSTKSSQPTFGQLQLLAKKLIGFTYASDELLEDAAIGLEALLVKLFGDAITWYEEESFWQGSGVGQPLGIMNSSALITPFRATANQIAIGDIGTLMSRFQGQLYARSTVFVGNQAIIPQLLAMGSTVVTWINISGSRVPTSLFGIPLHFTEHQATLGSVGDLGLYDLDKYVIGDRKGLKVDRSIEYKFSTDETAWRFVKRLDGQPIVDSSFTPKRGNTISPFVCLASTTQ